MQNWKNAGKWVPETGKIACDDDGHTFHISTFSIFIDYFLKGKRRKLVDTGA